MEFRTRSDTISVVLNRNRLGRPLTLLVLKFEIFEITVISQLHLQCKSTPTGPFTIAFG